MPISVTTALSKPEGSKKISAGTLGYVKTRARQHAYDLVIREFKKSGITQIALASRLGKPAEVVCRWLRRPRNWELDTFSELLFGISGAIPVFGVAYPLGQSAQFSSSSTATEATVILPNDYRVEAMAA